MNLLTNMLSFQFFFRASYFQQDSSLFFSTEVRLEKFREKFIYSYHLTFFFFLLRIFVNYLFVTFFNNVKKESREMELQDQAYILHI
jgi:hypothetical protein